MLVTLRFGTGWTVVVALSVISGSDNLLLPIGTLEIKCQLLYYITRRWDVLSGRTWH